MLKVYVLSTDLGSSTQLIELISKIAGLSFVSLSYDLIELVNSMSPQCKRDVIIVDKYIEESKIDTLTEMFSLVFKYVIYARNELTSEVFESANTAFLKAPYSYDTLRKISRKFEDDNMLNLAMNYTQSFDDHFFIRCEKGKIRRINIDEVLFIEAGQNYMNFHQQEVSFAVNLTLNGIEKALPADRFIRIHRSFIVNISKIRSIEASRILILGDTYVPIGQSYRKRILSFFSGKILEVGRIA